MKNGITIEQDPLLPSFWKKDRHKVTFPKDMEPGKSVDMEAKLGSAGPGEEGDGFVWPANTTCCIQHCNEGARGNRSLEELKNTNSHRNT